MHQELSETGNVFLFWTQWEISILGFCKFHRFWINFQSISSFSIVFCIINFTDISIRIESIISIWKLCDILWPIQLPVSLWLNTLSPLESTYLVPIDPYSPPLKAFGDIANLIPDVVYSLKKVLLKKRLASHVRPVRVSKNNGRLFFLCNTFFLQYISKTWSIWTLKCCCWVCTLLHKKCHNRFFSFCPFPSHLVVPMLVLRNDHLSSFRLLVS